MAKKNEKAKSDDAITSPGRPALPTPPKMPEALAAPIVLIQPSPSPSSNPLRSLVIELLEVLPADLATALNRKQYSRYLELRTELQRTLEA